MSGPALPQAGERLGPYELTSPLGVGGMSEVHRARDTRLGRDVAIKLLDFEAARNPERLRLFEQEARAASAVNHPAIVGVHDVGREGDVPYVVLELVEGETLQRRLLRGRLPQRRAIEVAVQIAQGLAAAHARGVLHNDLKPANIILTRDGRVKILDFGLAGLRGGGGTADPLPAEDRATVTQALFGTPGYIAPERIEGAPPDARSDLFSLGAVLYEMLAGTPAFGGGTTAEVLAATAEQDPPEIRPALPPPLDRIVRRALEKDPDQRFQSASDLAYALDAISAMTGAPVPAAWTRRRRWPRYAAGALALAALFAAGIWAGRYVWDRPLPSFQRLTFRYGGIASARFGPGGHSILYSAAWDGMPRLRLYSGQVDARGATELAVQGLVAAVGPSGELAYFPDRPYPSFHQAALSPGEKLAWLPMTGGAPREVLPDVVAADWSPEVFENGRRLAVVRDLDGTRRLEFPIGHVLYQTAYGLRAPRFSRQGDLIAVVETIASGDCITVVDLQGRRRLLTQGEDLISSTLGWSPDGSEIWFTGEKRSDQIRYGSWRPALRAVHLSGRERELLRLPQFQTLQDVAPDGRVLLTIGGLRSDVLAKAPGETAERNLSWHEGSSYTELTRDGRTLLFFEQAESATYLRPMDGGPAQRLCSGRALGLSPDGRWVVPMERLKDRLTLIPTDAREPLSVPAPAIVPWGFYWFADGHRLLVAGNEEGRRVKAWVIDTRDGSRRVITPEGIGCWLVSPDSQTAACATPEAEGYLYPVEGGGPPRPIVGFKDGDHMRQWSADGRYLYVSERYALPARVYRIDLQTGERKLWREFAPASPAGVVGTIDPAITPDGTAWAYAVLRNINDLFLVEGLR
jgi:Tol biopolymer transport system component